MRRAAAFLLAAISVACQRVQPATIPAVPAGPAAAPSFASAFEARVWGPGGRARFRGLLAAEGHDGFRAEIAAPSVAAPLVIVASGADLLAFLVSQRLFFRGKTGSTLLEEIAGVPVDVGAIPRLLGDALAEPPEGCSATRRTWRLLPPGGQVALSLVVRCGESGFRLRLREPSSLPPSPGNGRFSVDPPAGYRQVDLKDLVDALKGSPRARP